MAILRVINAKKAGRTAFLETLEYVSNPDKGNNMSIAKASNFQKQTLVNRVLLGKEFCKRQFKQFVVSMEETWPIDEEDCKQFAYGLTRMANMFKQFWLEQGYITEVWIHHNTKHPHFHMMVETCNAFDGKQFSQSTSELLQLKSELNSYLKELDFGERIHGSIVEISEEQLFEEGENDRFVRELEWYEESVEDFYEGANEWNNGTMEHPLREMVTYARDNNPNWKEGRQMVRIVTDEEKAKGREMVTLAPDFVKNKGYNLMNDEGMLMQESHQYIRKVSKMMEACKGGAKE